ncbi:MAG: hypothetical protein AAGB93_12170 [Planctomycetota bacterium]
MKTVTLCIALLPAATLTLGGGQAGPHGKLERGETAVHTFKNAPINALGVSSLEDLRGMPVLVAYWGRETWADDWVDDAVVWKKQFGRDVAIVMAEMQAADLDTIESVTLRKKWHGPDLMWTNEYPAFAGHPGVPQFSLLGNDGTLILDGIAGMMGMNFVGKKLQEIEDTIAEQVRLRREGPDGAPKEVAAAWRAFSDGEVGAALSAARALSASDDGAIAEAARAATAEFARRIDRRLARCEALLEAGRMVDLEEELEALEGQLAGEEPCHARHAAIVSAFDANEVEREASAALAKIKRTIDKKGPKKSSLRALEKFVKKYPDTKNAARASHWIALAARN